MGFEVDIRQVWNLYDHRDYNMADSVNWGVF